MAAYFFCVISSASLCAMESEVQKSKKNSCFILDLKKPEDSCVVKKALLCAEIMKKHEVLQEIRAIVKDNSYLLRMDAIHKKFDPFFRFNELDSRKCFKAFLDIFKPEFDRELCRSAQIYAHENCRKFDVVTPQHLFFFTESHDDILVSLISRQGCFVHDQGNF